MIKAIHRSSTLIDARIPLYNRNERMGMEFYGCFFGNCIFLNRIVNQKFAHEKSWIIRIEKNRLLYHHTVSCIFLIVASIGRVELCS